MLVVEIAGQMYSGKSYVSSKVIEHFSGKGVSILKTSLARELKNLVKKYLGITKYTLSLSRSRFLHEIDNNNFSENNIEFIAKQFVEQLLNAIGLSNCKKENFNIIRTKFTNIVTDIYLDDLGIKESSYSHNSRLIMQMFGTEIVRDFVSPNYWVDKIKEVIIKSKDYVDIVVIDDYRFPNESIKFADENDIKVVKSRIECDLKIRSERSDISVEDLLKSAEHGSEKFVPTLEVDYMINNQYTDTDKKTISTDQFLIELEKEINI